NIQEGEVVVDLGSGAGIDVFLAAYQAGARGRAIGIDMTPGMVERAGRAAEKSGITNVEFHKAL
ncbi:MAG: methyltransferase domain-containing protein, partial [Anaerolineae bacterium]|nr:methyltransferase domain-containing protein [Anaerolineae bacterium]NIN97364.1 methyltransferase domain-containing protein [Anaerolineae bacterium]NIQ78382.1 methyltransferase domain-containing protein [Anaerolineae bacterium]